LRDPPIEGGDQACETFRANHGINFEFLHVLLSPYLLGSRHRQKGLGHLLASVSLPDAVPSIFNQPSPPGTERMSNQYSCGRIIDIVSHLTGENRTPGRPEGMLDAGQRAIFHLTEGSLVSKITIWKSCKYFKPLPTTAASRFWSG
jgi:hypothetical protein